MTNITIPANLKPETAKKIQALIEEDQKPALKLSLLDQYKGHITWTVVRYSSYSEHYAKKFTLIAENGEICDKSTIKETMEDLYNYMTSLGYKHIPVKVKK